MMPFYEFIVQVVTSAAVSTSLAALLIWLSKTWISERLKGAIKSEYDQLLETHKAQLQAHSDIELEKLRSQMSIAAAERGVKFSRLHEERAAVVKETYSLLRTLFVSLDEYIKFVAPGEIEARRANVDHAHRRFRSYYTANLIFFPKKNCSQA